MEAQQESGTAPAMTRTGPVRLGIGLLQGIAAWLLLELVPPRSYAYGDAAQHQAEWWAQQHPTAFAILALVTAFVPTVALAETGRMRVRALAIYLAGTTAALAALVGYDLWRDPVESGWNNAMVRIWPSAGFIFCAGLGLFIVNQLMEHRERRHRLFTEYAAHFEDSWMRGFQFVISLVFTLLVWGVLLLGNALFGLIHVEWFGRMIEHNWFRCPVLAFAFAASVHITDVRPALLTGMRNLGLTLLSWLLPLVVALGCAFLAALFFTGLEPLWDTRFAASILLWSVTVTLVLLNAAYKDGDPAHVPVLPLRWAGRIAGPMMLVLTLLAIYAIAQRIAQYGWTPQRVQSVAVAAVALIYSGGYTWAAAARGPWLKRMERVNVTASLAILAILILLFTPLADPARLAVNSQVARLEAGKVAPAKFDYQFLRFDAGRFGTDALDRLTLSANPDITARARLAKAKDQRTYQSDGNPDPAQTEPALSHAVVYPEGAKLPADFGPKTLVDGNSYSAACLRDGSPCTIIVWKNAGRPAPLLIVREGAVADKVKLTDPAAPAAATAAGGAFARRWPVFGRNAAGKWEVVGQIGNLDCPGVLDQLRNGEGAAVRPVQDDLQVGGLRLRFYADQTEASACPAPTPAPVQIAPPAPADADAPGRMGPAFGKPGAL